MEKSHAYLKKDEAVHDWDVLQRNRIENLRHATATAVEIGCSAEKRNWQAKVEMLRRDHLVSLFLRERKPAVD